MSDPNLFKLSDTFNRRKRALQMLIDNETNGDPEVSNSYVDDVPNKKKDKIQKQQREAKCGFELRLERLNGKLPGNVELANLFHYCLIGSPVEKPAWTIFKNWRGFLQIVFFRVNCDLDYLENSYQSFKFINKFFNKDWTKLDSSVVDRGSFWREITNVRRSLGLEIKANLEGKSDPLLFYHDSNIRLKLLLSLQDLIYLQHPFPNEGLEDPQIKIIPTKKKYRKVTEKSPIFTLDCEMCMTESSYAELTRISMMDETGKIVIDSLVKPSTEITDYLTIYSGITPEVMKDVDITLEDIQKAISRILPDDAILCGHSLEFDLRAMRMSHPYCIDIGSLFDLKGKTRSRTSLKTLAQVFLKKEIQDETIGHCSVEDALATLELLRIKIEQGIHFGKISAGWDFQRWNQKEQVVPDYCTRYLNLIPTLGLPKEKDQHATKISTHNDLAEGATLVNSEPETKLNSKEIAQATEELVKSTTILPKFCKSCLTKIGTNCIAKECKCANVTPEICVRCLVKELIKKDVEKIEIEEEEEFLEWKEAVTIEQYKSSNIVDYVEEYAKKVTNKTVLAAFKNPTDFVREEKVCHLINSVDFPSLQGYIEAIKPRILEHRLCLLERDLTIDTVTYGELDKLVKGLVGSMSKNCLFLFMLTSNEKSILYVKVKNY